MVAIQGEKILQHRDNVAPELVYGGWGNDFPHLAVSEKAACMSLPAETSAAASATALVVLIKTFQRLYNQHKQATANPRNIFSAPFSGACYGRYGA